MKSAKRGICLFLSLTAVAFLFIRRVEACYQIYSPSVQLRAGTITGTITLNGKPIEGALLNLHKSLGAYSIELGHADARVLGEATTAKDGSFSFGEVPRGQYVVFMSRPSFEIMDIELVKPKKGESDTVAIEYFADWCGSATAISINGERLSPRSTPPILGRIGVLH
jgi:hypothetical protein